MKKIIQITLFSIFYLLISCSNETSVENNDLLIEDIMPLSGVIGDKVNIKFSGTQNINSIYVKFNNIEAKIIETNNNELSCLIPNTESGKIELIINNKSILSNEDFIIKKGLTIEEITPQKAEIGQKVVINFSGVDEIINNYSVKFDNKESEVINISDNQLTCIVPSYSKSGKIELKINNKTIVSDINFTVDIKDYPTRYYVDGGDFFGSKAFSIRSLYYDINENTFKDKLYSSKPGWYYERIDKIVYNKSLDQFIGHTGECTSGYFSFYGIWSARSAYCGGNKNFLTVFVDTNQNKSFTIIRYGEDFYLLDINCNGTDFSCRKKIPSLSYPIPNNVFVNSQNSLVYISSNNNYPNIELSLNKLNTLTHETSKEIIINKTNFSNQDLGISSYNNILYDEIYDRILIFGNDSDHFFELSLSDNTLKTINTSGDFINSSYKSINFYNKNSKIIFGKKGYTMDLSTYKIKKINSKVESSSYSATGSVYVVVD